LGRRDLLPPEIARWQFVEEKARSILDVFAFREVRTGGDDLAEVWVADRRWTREPASRWYRVGASIRGAVFGVAGPDGEAEVMAMLAAIAGDALDDQDAVETTALVVALRESGARLATVARDDGIVERLGGPPTPALTFEIQTAALVAALAEPAESFEPTPSLFVAAATDAAAPRALALANRLRLSGIRTALQHRPIPAAEAQRESARALRARLFLLVGESELALEDLSAGTREPVTEPRLEATIRTRMD
jgi:hypothetical protein